MGLINRLSFLLFSVLLVAAAVTYTVLTDDMTRGTMGTLVLATLLAIWWVLARRGAKTPANPEKRLRKAKGAGRPVAVYFYSDWSLGCLFMRPLTAAAEREHKSHFDFIYIEAGHPEAEAAAKLVQVGLNQWALIDGTGKIAVRAARITPAMLSEVLEKAH